MDGPKLTDSQQTPAPDIVTDPQTLKKSGASSSKNPQNIPPSTNGHRSPLTTPLVESTPFTRQPPASANLDKVQYNPFLRQGTSKKVKSTTENNSKRLDKKIT
jgi:hypothetical protein